MPNTQKKNKYRDDITTLDELLRASTELTTNQEEFGNNVVKDIDLMDAETRNSNSSRDNQYRSKIALIFTWSFVIIVGTIIICVPIYNATIGEKSPVDQNSLLGTFQSGFGTILGFVLGYYFKDKNESGKK